MENFHLEKNKEGQDEVKVELRGRMLLSHPMYNKSTAFSVEERARFGLDGLLPQHVTAVEDQERRVYEHIQRKDDPLEKYIGLAALQDRNEVLFYRLLVNHLEEFLPIVYTPTVGEACKRFSHIFRRGRGMWITPDHRGRIHEVLGNAPYRDVNLIVVTDSERILGLGDLGAGGMGIPIGKLALYTAGAGIHPTRTLPICLDVGTDNRDLLEDDLYIGWRHPRLRGEDYDSLVEEFVEAVKRRFPDALVQWEDFKKANAFRLLDRFKDRILSFNDDIQGTAAVSLAGTYAACRLLGQPLAAQRILILGAGAAGVGIARQLREALRREGLEGDRLTGAIAVLDSRGLLVEGTEIDDEHKKAFAWPRALAEEAGLGPDDDRGLQAVVDTFKPTVLIGTSGQAGIFTENVIRSMASTVERPVVFPISNPTANAEAVPADIIRWTEGRAVVATGSPFEPVEYAGRSYPIAQGNNVYIFPGVGLGAIAVRARSINDRLFTVAAEALAQSLTEAHLAEGLLYPRLSELRDISRRIAIEVARAAVAGGLAERMDDEEIERRVDELIWNPRYPKLLS
ncbi:MAG: NAD-dependent malic enzyme [Gammaproteobacteria bacterium]|jgi:malic enzyme